MKKPYLIFLIIITIGSFGIIPGVGDFFFPGDFPSINTDKETYYPNEKIHVNTSWNVLIDNTTEIVIIFTNYSLEQKPLDVAVNDATNYNFSVFCPVQSGYTIFETVFDSNNI